MSESRSPDSPWVGAQRALIDETFSNLSRLSRLPMLWTRAQRVKKGATPSEVVYEEDRLKLLHYPTENPAQFRTPLIFVFALVNRPYILDLLPGKSVVEHFQRAGFDTYLIDWGVPTHADRHLTLDDYVNGYLLNVVDHVIQRTGAPKVSILGYCMGGTMSAMFTALHPEKVRNLILLAAGIDFASRDGLLNIWTDPKTLDVDALVDAFGNCPAEFLQGSFLMLRPIANFIAKPIGLLERADDDRFVDEYFAMETWLNDNIPIAGEVYREFVKYLYQQNRLVKNQLPVGRRIVDLKRITCPVLNIMATEDDLVPCAQSEPFNDLVGSTDRKSLKLAAGHIGLAVGSRAQRELWPKAVEWLAERSDKTAPAPSRSRRRTATRTRVG
jgi:polyhydroxyalkanoate synthase subunit PhaC